ncbi:MAG: MliC family protein [Alphaproteobacteria bacterium]|nr:MliC family protein [Alphaproteobacteria bacterium]
MSGRAAAPLLAALFYYVCADGSTFTAQFEPKADLMLVERGGVAHTLAHQMSADGARYADKRLEVWGKGRGARVTDLTTGAAVQCEER